MTSASKGIEEKRKLALVERKSNQGMAMMDNFIFSPAFVDISTGQIKLANQIHGL